MMVRLVSADDGNGTGPVLAAKHHQNEQMGSKRKFWLRDIQTSRWFLFKYSRPQTGEHWSEKVACEVAKLLGLPHATVELAIHDGEAGVLVQDLQSDRAVTSMLHGNELLLEFDPTYPALGGYRVSEHTVSRIAAGAAQVPGPSSRPGGDAEGIACGRG